MSWFDIADALGHLFINNEKWMKSVYSDLNNLAKRFLGKINGECVTLIVSDHGMEPNEHDGWFGEHTKTAFWSLNVETDWQPEHVVDFFPKILEWVKE